MKQDIFQRKLRAGIVGGGQGAFIGSVHRITCELDGQAEVVAGAMSSDPQRAAASAQAWYLQRSYDSFKEMAAAEAGATGRHRFCDGGDAQPPALPGGTRLSGAGHPRCVR